VSASLGGMMRTAQVRVLAVDETPRLVSIDPAAATVMTGARFEFAVVFDIPAPAPGTSVNVSVDQGGMVPPSILVPTNLLRATFSFDADVTPAVATINAMLGADRAMATASVVASAGRGLVINEVDYDQAGTDMGEFVELFNASTGPVDLEPLALVFINGSMTPSAEYERIDLTGALPAGAYLLVANSGVTAPPTVTRILLGNNRLQNGAPDALAIFDTVAGRVVDALSYAGEVRMAQISGMTYDLVEGTAFSGVDNNTTPASLARVPNGTDTDNASTDFAVVTTPTPGASN